MAASVLAARYCASGNPQLLPGTAAGLITAGSNTISPEHGYRFLEAASAQMVAVAALAVLPDIMAHVIEETEHGKPLRIIPDAQADYLGAAERPLPGG